MSCVDHDVQSDVNFQDVWQAIEKVLLEDSLVVGTTEESQLTELSPVPQLHIPDATNIYCHNNSQEYADSCKAGAEDDFFPKRYEVATDNSKLSLSQQFLQQQQQQQQHQQQQHIYNNSQQQSQHQQSQVPGEMLEGIKVEEKLVNSILNDMLTSEDSLASNWFQLAPPPPPAPVDTQSEKSLLRQALISKRTKNKSSVETPPPPPLPPSQCNPLSTYKLEPMNRVNGNSDLLDLDSLVYHEIDKHSRLVPENNNEVRPSGAPNTSKLLSCLARGTVLPALLPGVRLPDTPLPAAALFPGSAVAPRHNSPESPKTRTEPVTVPQCTVIQLPTSNIRLEMEVIDHLLKKSDQEEPDLKSSTKNRKVNLKKRKSLPCVEEVKKARVVGGERERASVDSVLLEARLQPSQPSPRQPRQTPRRNPIRVPRWQPALGCRRL